MKVNIGQRLLGSSEAIESVIGRYKLIEERACATRSVTPTVLAIGALVGEVDAETIRAALVKIPTRKLVEWCAENIGVTDCAKRRNIFKVINSSGKNFPLIQTQSEEHGAVTEKTNSQTTGNSASDKFAA